MGTFADYSPLHAFASILWYSLRVAAPIWIPLLLLLAWYELWITYKQRQWIKDQGSVLLEIKLPREINKSPEAMELFFNNLYESGVGSVVDVFIKGRVRNWFSLELVSIGGTVHFYIWMHKKFKERVESQLYSQFPNIEVHEVADYAIGVHRDPEKINIGYIGQMTLNKDDVFPLKTYIDYKLNEPLKEEGFRADPLTGVIEYLGSLRRGEQAWIQILIRAHTEEKGIKYFQFAGKKPKISDRAKEVIKKYIADEAVIKTEDTKTPSVINLSNTQRDIISAVERTTGKYGFDSLIRCAYLSEKDAFNPNNIGGLLGSFRQFSSPGYNGIRPDFGAAYDNPWQDFRGIRKAKNEVKLLEAYKRRGFFEAPFKNFHGKPYVFSTEELATLFHFPPQALAATPSLSRIPSKKAEAPANLPI